MTAPDVVVLDSRGAGDQESFLSACARDLAFPDGCGSSWDALADCLADFVARRSPVLVVWTGASDLPVADLRSAMEIMAERFTEGADVLIVDAEPSSPPPAFAIDHVHLPIPADGETDARRFWTEVVGLQESPAACGAHGICMTGDALSVHLSTDSDGLTMPAIATSHLDALIERLRAAGYGIQHDPAAGRVRAADPFGNPIEFIEFPHPEEEQ